MYHELRKLRLKGSCWQNFKYLDWDLSYNLDASFNPDKMPPN